MTLTQKEKDLLTDMKSQEELCIEKYGKYEQQASDCVLKGLFSGIRSTEEGHLGTLNKILGGEKMPEPKVAPTAVSQKLCCEPSGCTQAQKQSDAYLCKDALSMEKHTSALYDTGIFEFSDPVLRDTLSHIQKEEQNHGEQLYNYLATNGMYPSGV